MDIFHKTQARRIQSTPITSQHEESPQPSSISSSQKHERISQTYITIPRTQEELDHVSRIPRTPSPCEQLGNFSFHSPHSDSRDCSRIPGTPRSRSKKNDRGFKPAHESLKRRRMETIIDEEPLPKRKKGQANGDAPRPFSDLPTGARSKGSTKLQPVPNNAPRGIERKGKYTFVKGVRIKDYKMPVARSAPPQPESRQYQCCDGFDSDRSPASRSHLKKNGSRETNLQSDGKARSPPQDLPLTPRSASPQDVSTREQGQREDGFPMEAQIKKEDS